MGVKHDNFKVENQIKEDMEELYCDVLIKSNSSQVKSEIPISFKKNYKMINQEN